jgi:hypothetical protein
MKARLQPAGMQPLRIPAHSCRGVRQYDTLYQSSQGWHEGQHNRLPGVGVFLGSHAAISLSGV